MRNLAVKRSPDDVTLKSSGPDAQPLEAKESRKFTDVIGEEILNEETRMVLVNAVGFRGIWNFKVDKTSKGSFSVSENDSVEVDFIETKNIFKFGELKELEATAVELPFKDSQVSILIVLPNSTSGLSALEGKLQSVDWNAMSKKMSDATVSVKVPMFDIEFNTELDLVLQRVRTFPPRIFLLKLFNPFRTS